MAETRKPDAGGAGLSGLDELLPFLETFAVERNLQPEPAARDTFRQFRHGDRAIEAHLDTDNDGKWSIWICASGFCGGKRYCKRCNLNGPVPRCHLQSELNEALCAV